MTDSIFRSNLLQKNLEICRSYLSKDLQIDDLILIINDMIYASVSVVNNKFSIHPVCLVNAVKNIISENKNNPPKELLFFTLNYLFQYDFRINDQYILDKTIRDGLKPIACTADLEDACQNQDWPKAELIMAHTFMASDRSRGTFDLLAELALQNVPQNGLVVFHILRAYQFQENKSDNWAFTKAMFDQISNQMLLNPHERTDATPWKVNPVMVHSEDIILLSAISRIWNGDYVRIDSYKRELSHWLSEIFANKLSEKNLFKDEKINSSKSISYLSIAEKILYQKKSMDEKAIDLLRLESIRGLSKFLNINQIKDLNKKFNNFSV